MRYRLNIIDEAMSLVTLLFESDRRMSLTELTLASGMTKNKTFRMLTTLELQGILDKDKQGRYYFGINTFMTVRHVFNRIHVPEIIRPLLEKVAAQLNEDVYLARKIKGKAILVTTVNSSQKVTIRSYIGSVLPESPDEKSEALRSSHEVFDGARVSVGMLDPEITTVAMDIPGFNEQERAALVVVAPTFRMSPERIRSDVIPIMYETVCQMEHFSGWSSGAFRHEMVKDAYKSGAKDHLGASI
jgi:DNA-binding IclR family transcriptional regulator